MKNGHFGGSSCAPGVLPVFCLVQCDKPLVYITWHILLATGCQQLVTRYATMKLARIVQQEKDIGLIYIYGLQQSRDLMGTFLTALALQA